MLFIWVIYLATISISVPEDLKKKIERYETVNWSAVARKAFAEQLSKQELMDKLTAKSKATEKDISELSRKIKTGIAKWHNERV